MMMSAQINYGRRPSQDVMLPLNPRMIVEGANYSIGFWKREKLPDDKVTMMSRELFLNLLATNNNTGPEDYIEWIRNRLRRR